MGTHADGLLALLLLGGGDWDLPRPPPLSRFDLSLVPGLRLFSRPLELLLMPVSIKLAEKPEAIWKFGNAYRAHMREAPTFNLCPDGLPQLFAGEEG